MLIACLLVGCEELKRPATYYYSNKFNTSNSNLHNIKFDPGTV